MFSKVQVVNLGLSKIGSSRVTRLDPPVSSLERFIDSGYLHWRRSELTKRRWVFALEENYPLAKVEELEEGERRYVYDMPVEALRPVRDSSTEWKQRGERIYSAYDNLKATFVFDKIEPEFDPLFVEVLACRIGMECTEYVTQSNTKGETAERKYERAVTDAGRVNAFIMGPEDINGGDEDYPFLTARY